MVCILRSLKRNSKIFSYTVREQDAEHQYL